MGICESNQKHRVTPPQKLPNVGEPPLPEAKYRLQFPHATDSINAIPVYQVNNSIIFNYVVKRGVQKQKSDLDSQADSIGVFIYTEKFKNNYSEYGFYMIDLNRLDQLMEEKKHIRVLFNFKVVWVFRDFNEKFSGLISRFQDEGIKIKQVNFYPKPLGEFMSSLKMQSEISIINSVYPLLMFDNSDVLDQTRPKEDLFRIYMHNSQSLEKLLAKKQATLYLENLKVRNLIFLYPEVNFNVEKQLKELLYQVRCFDLFPQGAISFDTLLNQVLPYLRQLSDTSSPVVFIYNSELPSGFVNARTVIEQHLRRSLLLYPDEIKQYLDMLRSLHIQELSPAGPQVNMRKQQTVLVQPKLELNRTDEMLQLYEKLLSKVSAIQLVQSCHDVIVKLLTNMINNPNDAKFKTIQTTNKTIKLNVIQYAEGKQLLQQVGFVEKQQEFVNNLDIGMLKIAKIDLELAFKKFLDLHQRK